MYIADNAYNSIAILVQILADINIGVIVGIFLAFAIVVMRKLR